MRKTSLPLKPCEGQFSDDLQQILSLNRQREQWGVHTCQLCGASIGAVQVQGKWVPEQHWPSVKYPARNAVDKKQSVAAKSITPDDSIVFAGSGSR